MVKALAVLAFLSLLFLSFNAPAFVGVSVQEHRQPPVQWVVASRDTKTRPIYDFRLFRVKRKEVGRAPIGAPCHFGFVEASNRGREWHPFKMHGGKYGVVLCEVKQ